MVKGMSTPGWRTSMVVHGFDLEHLAARGRQAVPSVPVVAGLLETASGGLQFALRTGLHGSPVVLTLQAASQHIVNVREVLIERLRISGDRLG
jgi:hypothetical protein